MLSRDSARRHHPCKKLNGVTTCSHYSSIVSSDKEPDAVRNAPQSEDEGEVVEEEEDKDHDEGEEKLDISGTINNSAVSWQAPMHRQLNGVGSDMMSVNAQQPNIFWGALQFHQQLIFDQRRQRQDELASQRRQQQDELASQRRQHQDELASQRRQHQDELASHRRQLDELASQVRNLQDRQSTQEQQTVQQQQQTAPQLYPLFKKK